MIIQWDGQEYQFEHADIRIKQAVVIKQHTGFPFRAWVRESEEGDPQALQALLWVIKQQNGERVDIASLDFSVTDFLAAFDEGALTAIRQEVEAEMRRMKADPPDVAEEEDGSTPGQTPTSATSETATSEYSDSSST